ncbi:MAG: RNA polymerase sigma factor [Phycisphaerales bacterium]|nr:RNA polymerase sigma factor [Phycisphaerales bacterium]
MPDPSPPSRGLESDEQLLARFVRGDTPALGLLADRYEPLLLGLATGILGNPEAARDAVQDSWLRVIRHARGFAGRSSAKTWLYRIVINRSIDARSRLTSDAHANGTLHASEIAPDTMSESAAPALRIALSSLPESTRLLLLLCYHQGLTHQQAADVLDIPVGTLKSRLHTALQALRASLAREEHQ